MCSGAEPEIIAAAIKGGSEVASSLINGREFDAGMVQNLMANEAAKGTLSESDPVHIPLEMYGNVYVVAAELGRGRQVGGVRP
jgi:TRAP-type uncharacterized transport system substrate-binding protein